MFRSKHARTIKRIRKIHMKVVTIGGGTGQFTLLSAIRDLELDITAIVSMVDSGGSTGRLRDELGVLPPGDILKCVLALSEDRTAAREILQKRFKENSKLSGHSVGNMLLTMLTQYTGDFAKGVEALGDILSARGKVLPVTTDKATLVAELPDGSGLYGEAAIDVPRGEVRKKIQKSFLVPHHSDRIRVHPPVIEAIEMADYIIIGPGDLYTSIVPNLLVQKVAETIRRSDAQILFIVNVMTKFGETDNFTGKDFILNLESFINRKVDTAIFNSAVPQEDILREYKKQKASLVEVDMEDNWGGRKIIKEDILNSGDILRHDSQKLAEVIDLLIV